MAKVLATAGVTALLLGLLIYCAPLLRPARRDPFQERDPGRELPERLLAFAGAASGLAILITQREPDEDLRRGLDRATLQALGVREEGGLSLLQVAVISESEQDERFDPRDLVLITKSGARIPLERLRDLAQSEDRLAALQTTAHDFDPELPLAPGHTRLGLAILKGPTLEEIEGGEYRSMSLVRGSVKALAWIAWLESNTPSAVWRGELFTAETKREDESQK